MTKREFHMHDQDQIDRLTKAFEQKIATNRKRGEQQIRERTVKPFTGFSPEKLKNEYNFTLELTEESQQQIHNRVVEPLMQLAQKHGVEGIYPFHGDEPPHFTIDITQFTNLNKRDKKRLWKKLDKDRYLDMISIILSNIGIRLDSFVISGNSMYLCVGTFNPDVYPVAKARRLIDKVIERDFSTTRHKKKGGKQTVDYTGIVHATVGRITKLPTDPTALESFAKEATQTIEPSLASQPIVATVQDAYHGTSYHYSKTHEGVFEKRENAMRRILRSLRINQLSSHSNIGKS